MSQVKGEIMKIRKIAIAGILATGIAAGSFAVGHGTPANAASTRLQTVSKTETIVSAKCYDTRQVTTTYYTFSSTHGWVLNAKPRVTVTTSRTCHK
jgi:hypothetical protein